MNQTRALCEFLTAMTPGTVGEANLRDIGYKTLDWCGCAVAALRRPSALAVRALLLEEGGSRRASAVGVPERTCAQQAAFYNGMLSHALEYDDTSKIAITHPGAPVISAALAAAEAHGATFQDYAVAVAAGYEAMIRLGGAINPSHYRFWHTTGTCGAFAAAAAVSRILGLDAARMEAAMGIASTTASGLVYVFGTDAKLVTVGNAARNGLLAAELAARGLSAPEDAFSGEQAYARSANGESDLSFMVPRPGDKLLLEEAYYKMHASCGHTHSALDALQGLMAEHPFRPEDVQSVRVQVYETAWRLCAAYRAETEARAKFSLPYCLSVLLLRGKCTLSEFAADTLDDPAVAEYAKRITVSEHPAYTASYPGLRTEKVTLFLRDGRRLERAVELPAGRPPYGFLEEKFNALAELTISHDRAEALKRAILSAGAETPMEQICSLLRALD